MAKRAARGKNKAAAKSNATQSGDEQRKRSVARAKVGFRPELHPRGRDGRFINKPGIDRNGAVRMIGGSEKAADETVALSGMSTVKTGDNASVDRYSSDEGYRAINDGLRGKGKLSAADKSDVAALEAQINKSTLKRDIIVHRGMDNLPTGVRGGKLTAGRTFSDKAFVSTSLSSRTADEFIYRAERGAKFEIAIPAGKKALYLKKSDYADEYEVLLPKETKFKVKSVQERIVTNGPPKRTITHYAVEVV